MFDKQNYMKQYCKEWRKNNAEKIKEHRTRYNQENREQLLLANAKKRAKLKGLDFTLKLSDIVIPTHCTYLKVELTRTAGVGCVDTNASLDRIDSAKGYTPDNIQVISHLANSMKNSATTEQLIQFSKSVLEQHGYTITKNSTEL